MANAVSFPCFPAHVSLVEPCPMQLAASIKSIGSVLQNFSSICVARDMEFLLQTVNPPESVNADVLCFHWDQRLEMGFYVPFDVLPMVELLGAAWNLVEENSRTPFFREIRGMIEQKYKFFLDNFGGPFAFGEAFTPADQMCTHGRITPRRVAVPNPHRRAPMAGDERFQEFAHALATNLYPCLQWHGTCAEVTKFLATAVADSRPFQAALNLAIARADDADADADSAGAWTPPRTPAALSDDENTNDSREEEPSGVTMDPDTYRESQFAHVMALKKGDSCAKPVWQVAYTIHFADLDWADEKISTRMRTLSTLETHLRRFYTSEFWAEVVVRDQVGNALNHATFEAAVRQPLPHFQIFMHRFLPLPTAVRISTVDRPDHVQVVLKPRCYHSLVRLARGVGGRRLGIPGITDGDYAVEIHDTDADGDCIEVTPGSYGMYLRTAGAVMTALFVSPPPRAQGRGAKRGPASPPPAPRRR